MFPTHQRYAYSMIDRRPAYDWPGGKRLAFYIGTNVEYFAYGAGTGSDPAFGNAARQTQRNYAWRDYGHRVGMWRLFDLLDELKLPAAHNMSSLVCTHRPDLWSACVWGRRDHRPRPHAIGAAGSMWEEAEAQMVTKQRRSSNPPMDAAPTAGWGGHVPHAGHVDVLQKRATILMDWCCDDQPFWRRRAPPHPLRPIRSK